MKLRTTFEREVGAGFARFMGWVAPLVVAIILLDAFVVRASHLVVALDSVLLVLVVAARVAFERGLFGARATNPVATGLVVIILGMTFGAMRSTHDLAYTLGIVVALLVASSLMTSASWFLATGAGSVLCWVLLSPTEPRHSEIVRLVGLATTLAVGVMMLRHRLRLLDRFVVAARDAEAGKARAEAALARVTAEVGARERAESERESLRGQFLHAQKMEGIGTLAAGAAHDMNNVLSAATALATIVREQVSGRTAEDVDNLLLALDRGSELTRSLLSYSRKPEGKPSGEVAIVRGALESVVKLVRRTLPKTLAIELESPAPELTAVCDPAQLSHALLNLCINASDAMNGKGRIQIEVAAARVGSATRESLGLGSDDCVVISVKDDGCGMDEETRRRAVEPFFTTKGAKGSGLGLAMVCGAMRNHGGAVSIESAPGRGTTVSLYLPRGRDANVDAEPPSDSAVRLAPRPHQRRLLLVDDDGLARRATRRLLERLGYAVVEATDGVSALRVYREQGPFDAVLLDIAMPDMDGFECLAQLRQVNPEAQVLMFSSATAERERTLAAGATGFVAKPLEPDGLERAIAACFE